MKVFISWSGERSKAVATLLKEWIPSVMQHVEVWFSDDMERGSVWFNEICKGLSDVSVGVICLTQENLNNPWILFEAGAIAKGITENRVCTLLIDLKPEDVSSPLSQFNATLPNRDSLFKLIKTINDASGDNALPLDRLERSFSAFWSDFDSRFKDVLSTIEAPSTKNASRPQKEVMADILESVRRIERNTLSLKEFRNTYLHDSFPPPPPPSTAHGSYGIRRLRESESRQSCDESLPPTPAFPFEAEPPYVREAKLPPYLRSALNRTRTNPFIQDKDFD